MPFGKEAAHWADTAAPLIRPYIEALIRPYIEALIRALRPFGQLGGYAEGVNPPLQLIAPHIVHK